MSIACPYDKLKTRLYVSVAALMVHARFPTFGDARPLATTASNPKNKNTAPTSHPGDGLRFFFSLAN